MEKFELISEAKGAARRVKRRAPKAKSAPKPRPAPAARQTPAQARAAKPIAERVKLDSKGNPVLGKQPADYYKLSPEQQVQAVTKARALKVKADKVARKAKYDHIKRKYNVKAESFKRRSNDRVITAKADLQRMLTQPHHSPLVRKGFVMSVVSAVLYNVFSGKNASGTSPEMSAIATSVAKVPETAPIVPEALSLIESTKRLTGSR